MKRLTRSMPSWLSILISAVVFGVAHIMIGAYLFPMTFIGGLIFAFVYYKSNSLIPAILAHMGANIGGIISDFWDYSLISPYFISIISFVLFAIMLLFFSRREKQLN